MGNQYFNQQLNLLIQNVGFQPAPHPRSKCLFKKSELEEKKISYHFDGCLS